MDYLSFYLSAFIKLLIVSRRNYVLVAKTDPPLLSVMLAVVARMRGAKLVTWLQDLFPEVAEVVGVKGVSGFLAKALKYLRNLSLRTAEMNVVIGEGMAERLRREGIDPNKIRVIHNWSKESFDLIVRPVIIEGQCWVAAKAIVAPGVTMGEGAIPSLGSVATSDLQPWSIYQGNPAILKGLRTKSIKKI